MGRQRVSGWRVATAAVVATMSLGACTSAPEPATPAAPTPDPPAPASPPAGLRVGFVLPPAASDEDDQRLQLAADLQQVDELRAEGISDLRVLEADGPEFVGDLATLLAERGTDLVCVLGPQAQQVVAPLAVRHPQLRFCAVPAGASEPPTNLAAVDLRFDELGHLLGAAAAEVAGDGPIAAIIGSDRAGVTRLRDGIRAAVTGIPLLERAPNDEEEVAEAVDEAIEAGASVLVLDLGTGAVDAVERAAEAGLLVVAPAAVMDQVEGSGPVTLLAWQVRWELPLRSVVAALLDPDVRVPDGFGLADDVFDLRYGAALTDDARERLEAVESELRRGQREPRDPPPGSVDAEPVDEEQGTDVGSAPDDGDG
jgi:basic membrane lipoprotein Med (substrate-binding protein (PBP1-ABC) superfamily)